MNLMYLFNDDISQKEYLGVRSKIDGQLNGMKSNGYSTTFITCDKESIVFYNKDNQQESICNYNNFFQKKMYFFGKRVLEKIKDEKVDIVYIRYTLSEPFFLNFIRNLKKMNKIVFLEIPTYPYDLELPKNKLGIDKFFRQFLKKYIDKVIISSYGIHKIYNVSAIYIDNGIDVERIQFIERKYNLNKKVINLIGVSLLRKCIGYDRVIEGMKFYYQSDKKREFDVQFTIVGEGEELENLKLIVKNYNLDDKVIFTGFQNGLQLDKLYQESDIAIGSLADHRLNVSNKAPLKSREYCARGIPFVSSVKDKGFSGDLNYIKLVSQDETPIDIYDIVEFYKILSLNSDISKKMREYAMNNFDWRTKYKNLHEYI